MTKRLSIHAGPPIQAALSATRGAAPTKRTNDIVERYNWIVNDELSRLAFSRDEWLAIMAALNGYWTETDESTIWSIHLEIADANGMPAGLAATIEALSFAAKVAIVEARDRFWAASRNGLQGFAALVHAGVRIYE